MYPNGSLVTLVLPKVHGEGEDAVRLAQGVCGMVVQGKRKTDNNHQYVVEFGAYGQWYCNHDELNGDDKEGWDADVQAMSSPGLNLDWLTQGPQRPPREHNGPEVRHDDDEDPREDDEDLAEELHALEVDAEPTLAELTPEQQQEAGVTHINVEEDIKRRMHDMEKGECFDS